MSFPGDFREALERALENEEQNSIGYCFISLDSGDCYYNMLWAFNNTAFSTFKKHFNRVYTPEEFNELSYIVNERIEKFLEKFPRFRVGDPRL
ncbi:MAG: hypothetical protein M1518_02840 [Candidatus Thermoplasmatota archaeon]|jgi:hypothetical protein|nr:hypothetical protein [Candidatus Thermoplasmatota archaeon]